MAALVMPALGGEAGAAAKHSFAFRPVLADVPQSVTTAPSAAATAAVANCDPTAVEALASVPTTKPKDDDPQACVVLAARYRSEEGIDPRYLLGPAQLDADAVQSATAEFISGQGWTVRLRLTKSGAKAWDALAEQQFHEKVAIVSDHAVVSAPLIQPGDVTFASFRGTAVISGTFSKAQAKAFAKAIGS